MRAKCLGCGKRVQEYYALNTTLWLRLVAEADRAGELCWVCLTDRLGRAPRRGDFRKTPIEMVCHMGLTSEAGHDAWRAVFPKSQFRVNHALFKKIAIGTTSVGEFEQRLIDYARSLGLLL